MKVAMIHSVVLQFDLQEQKLLYGRDSDLIALIKSQHKQYLINWNRSYTVEVIDEVQLFFTEDNVKNAQQISDSVYDFLYLVHPRIPDELYAANLQ